MELMRKLRLRFKNSKNVFEFDRLKKYPDNNHSEICDSLFANENEKKNFDFVNKSIISESESTSKIRRNDSASKSHAISDKLFNDDDDFDKLLMNIDLDTLFFPEISKIKKYEDNKTIVSTEFKAICNGSMKRKDEVKNIIKNSKRSKI